MKKFVFKLETVRKYRQLMEGLAKNAYQEALRVQNKEKKKLKELIENKKRILALYNIESGEIVNQDNLEFLAHYTAQLNFIIMQQHQVIKQKEKIVEECFQEWNNKRKDFEVIKRLRKRQWSAYMRETEKEDQKFQDEIYIAKKIREGS